MVHASESRFDETMHAPSGEITHQEYVHLDYVDQIDLIFPQGICKVQKKCTEPL